jgi:hypothetical protein
MRRLYQLAKTISLTVLLGVAAVSCKKDPAPTAVPPVGTSPGHWMQNPDINGNVNKLTTDAGHLYFSVKHVGYYRLQSLSPQGAVATLANPPLGSVIRDIAMFNDALFYAGYIPTNTGNHLFSIDLSNYVTTGYDMPLQGSANGITSLLPFGGRLIFSGNFDASTSFAASSYSAALQASGQTTAMNGLASPPRGLHVYNGNIYAYGKLLKTEPASTGIANWYLGNWDGLNYVQDAGNYEVHSMAIVNDVIYMTYQLNSGGAYHFGKVENSSQIEPVTDISIASADGYIRVEEINGELYAYGRGLYQGGISTNVFRKEGNSWVIDKLITEDVNDLEFFEGHLYAATAGGLYRD